MIRIITDSLSDFTPDDAKELNIDLMALAVNFGDESFKSGYELANEDFYEKLVTSNVSPSTAAVNPFEFEEKFKEYIDQGDEVIAILFAKELSATYQSAVIAKDALDSDKIHLIDCRTGTLGQGILVKAAAMMRNEGKSAEEIVAKVTELIPRARVFVVLDTLEYLKRGGRISPSVAFVGGVLGLHPIITIQDGKIDLIDKAKGKKSMNKWLLNKLEELPVDEDYPLFIGHSNAKEKAEVFAGLVADKSYGKDTSNYCLGPVVGTHVGPNAIAVGYISKN